ncbi:MAG: hypothetical protein NDJ94_18055 [Vicinamibacteria bacterium]|nr:hypothetical protein [Vicinamibacteria bacterium]
MPNAGRAPVVCLLVLSIFALGVRADEPPLVLTGLDPVRLAEGVERDGDETRARVHDGFTYLFESDATRTRFDADPGRYAVQQGGLCARMGGTTLGNPDLYAVHDGRLYLFGSPDCQRAFRAEPGAYLERLVPRAPVDAAALAGGEAWAAKALATTGGAAAWRAIGTWREHGRAGDRGVLRAVDFSGRLRLERLFPQFRIVEVVGPETAFVDAGRGPRPLRSAQVAALRREAELAPAALLRALAVEPGALAAADRGEERADDGRTLRRLEVALGERTATLLLDAVSGRPAGVRAQGRGAEGRVADVTEWWLDWRATGAVWAPFGRQRDGQPQPLVFDEIGSPAALDAALFTRP